MRPVWLVLAKQEADHGTDGASAAAALTADLAGRYGDLVTATTSSGPSTERAQLGRLPPGRGGTGSLASHSDERLLVVLIVGFFGTLPLASMLTLDLGFPLTIAHLFAAAIALTLLWQDRLRPRVVTWLPASLLLAFCVAYALSFAVNLGGDQPQFSWTTGRNAPEVRSATKVLWLLGNIAIAAVIANAVRRSGSERRAIQALAVGAVVAAVYGLYEVIGGTHGFFVPVLPGTGPIVGRPFAWVVLRAGGAFLEPNHFGAYLAAALPFVAVGWMRLEAHRATGTRTTGLLLSLTIAGVIVTFAIGGWLPAAVAGVVLLALSGPIGARALLVRFGVSAAIATLAMVILIPNFPRAASALVFKGALAAGAAAPAASDSPTTTAQPSSATAQPEPSEAPAATAKPEPLSPADAQISVDERSAFVQAGLRMFASSPIVGIGPGNFGLRYPEFRSPGVPEPPALSIANNIYVELLAETGLVGFLAFFGGFIGLAALAVRASRREHGDNRVELAAGIAAMAAIATAFLAGPTFTLLYQWAILGLVGALVARSRQVHPAGDLASDVGPVRPATR